MRGILALFRSNAREFRRDPTTLMWTLVFPIVITLFMGIIFSDSIVIFEISIVNEAGSAGAPLITVLESNPALTLKAETREVALEAFSAGKRSAVLIIPAGIASALETGPIALEVICDPGAQNAPLILSALQAAITHENAVLTATAPPLIMQPQTLTARELRRIDYIMPGVLSMTLMQLGLMATAPLLVSLRERHVLRRMRVTPLRRVDLLLSQVGFRLIVAVGQAGVMLLLGMFVYGIDIAPATLPAIAGVTVLGAAVFLTMGYVLAAFARTEDSINSLIGLPNVLFMLMSGIFFPVSDMPAWARPVVDLIPLSYLGDALRQLIVDAPPLYTLTTDILILAAWLIGLLLLAVRLFHWEPQS